MLDGMTGSAEVMNGPFDGVRVSSLPALQRRLLLLRLQEGLTGTRFEGRLLRFFGVFHRGTGTLF